jgi:hypothetical protein
VAEAAPAVSFLDSLPEDLRGEPSLRNFNDVGALAKSYTHAQRMIGGDKIGKPQQSWTDDQWTEHHIHSGRPETSEGYEFRLEGQLADSTLEGFRDSAFKAGLSGKQAQSVAEFMDASLGQMATDRADQADTLRHEGEQELRQQYGKAFDQRMEMAMGAARQMLGDKVDILEEVELSDGRLLGDHPEIIRMFSAFAEQIGEDNLIGETAELVMTPDEARRQLAEVTRQDGPYWDRDHPERQAYVDEGVRLRTIMLGE